MAMETVRVGRVWKFGDHISTDFMMPGHRVLANPDLSVEDAAKFCMEANRPGWAESEVQPGDILVAGINFGCGSSRNASQSLKALNIAVAVCKSDWICASKAESADAVSACDIGKVLSAVTCAPRDPLPCRQKVSHAR